jgi:competence protein ComEA
LKKISAHLNLTEIELKVSLFLSTAFFIGLFSYYLKYSNENIGYKEFEYSKQDSLFYQSEKEKTSAKKIEKRVDSKQELLDFSVNKNKDKELIETGLDVNSININKADVETLVQLPGIGIKTAERIIELRSKRNGFRNLDELLNVKGIGEKKFKKFKKYIFID